LAFCKLGMSGWFDASCHASPLRLAALGWSGGL
jgi:hypothetical protein